MANLSKIRVRGILHNIVDATARSGVNQAQSRIDTLSNNYATLSGSVTQNTANIGALQTSTTANTSNISTLQGQMTTANANISKAFGTVLWSGALAGNKGLTLALSDNISNYKYVEIYFRSDFSVLSSSGSVAYFNKCCKTPVTSGDTFAGLDFHCYLDGSLDYVFHSAALKLNGTSGSVIYAHYKGSSSGGSDVSSIIITKIVGYKEV